jgi:hypothetical protein
MNITEINIKAVAEGVYNFKTNNENARLLAEKRYIENCIDCTHFAPEKNEFFKVIDKQIPELSNMQCTDCGCVLSYKLRQSIKICKKW